MTIKTSTQNTDILRKIRRGETFQTTQAEFNWFMIKLDKFPEYKPVEFTMKIDTQKITISPVKTPKFYRTFKVFAGVVVSVNLIKGARVWKKVGVLKSFLRSKKVGK